MKRIVSKNPGRNEENKDKFDFFAGKFIVSYGDFIHEFPYIGSNIIEAKRNRKHMKEAARSWYTAFKPFYPDIILIEKDI